MPKPDWILEWRDPSHYQRLKGCKDESTWAWEFLRRNPEFQRTCETLNSDKPPSQKWGSTNIPIDRSSAAERFGLTDFPADLNPSNNTPPSFITNHYPAYKAHRSIKLHIENSPLSTGLSDGKPDNHEIFIAFSSGWSIQSQLKKAEEILKEHCELVKEKDPAVNCVSRNTFEQYPIYLRILDAKSHDNIPDKEIAEVLFNSGKTINTTEDDSQLEKVTKGYETAKSLRDGGYAKIVGIYLSPLKL